MPTAAQLSAKLSKKRLAELLAEACLENETLAHRLETNQGELGGYDRIQIAQALCEKRRWQEALDLVADVDAKGSWVDMIEAIQLEAYQGLGQIEKVAAIRRAEFLRYPSAERLQDWLDALAPEQREAARSEGIAYAESDDCYPYAARYWRALAELAPRIQFPDTIENEAAYKARLSEPHKRKTSFWRAMDQQ